jgi:hypothetical protein
MIFLFLKHLVTDSVRAADRRDRHVRGGVRARLRLDNLSLIALTLAVGFVVDDAIVMLGNIVATWRWGNRR